MPRCSKRALLKISESKSDNRYDLENSIHASLLFVLRALRRANCKRASEPECCSVGERRP